MIAEFWLVVAGWKKCNRWYPSGTPMTRRRKPSLCSNGDVDLCVFPAGHNPVSRLNQKHGSDRVWPEEDKA